MKRRFIDEETRCGFTVTEQRKKLWQIQLELLQVVNDICQRNGIKYYAMGGTLLGAIRHRGFIPWDDDIDICMFRSDYDSFVSAANKELVAPFFLQSPFTDPDYAFPHIKIRNSNTVGATKYDFDFNYNKGVFIDIFPLDRLPDDPSNRNSFLDGVKFYNRLLNIGCRKFWYIGTETISKEERMFCESLFVKRKIIDVYAEFECFCKMYNNDNTTQIGVVSLETSTSRFIWDAECFNDVIQKEFEYMSIPVPVGYDSMLKKTYGDYHKMVQGGALHGGLIFEPNIPFQEFQFSTNLHFLE